MKITWWSPNLNWKQLTTKGSLINLQSILFLPVLQFTDLPDTFCWNLPHKMHFLAEVPPLLACVMSSPVPKIQGPVHSLCHRSPMWLSHSFPIWITQPSNSNLTSVIIPAVHTKLQNSLRIPYSPYRISQVLQFAMEFYSHFLPTARNWLNS